MIFKLCVIVIGRKVHRTVDRERTIKRLFTTDPVYGESLSLTILKYLNPNKKRSVEKWAIYENGRPVVLSKDRNKLEEIVEGLKQKGIS